MISLGRLSRVRATGGRSPLTQDPDAVQSVNKHFAELEGSLFEALVALALSLCLIGRVWHGEKPSDSVMVPDSAPSANRSSGRK